ncbi:tubulin delta chain-like [Babylonia areolata]|uniref:tubulin delta chain-like n=1 Tax=Babylonia areolata TaxID=304850 RepID=UPI003FD54F59
MSIITLQLGQCGNQVGGQLFSSIMDDLHASPAAVGVSPKQNSEYVEESKETFFSERKNSAVPVARAVMVDMETKAISQTMTEAKKSGRWVYPDKQQLHQKRGSGNNWAHGYCLHGPAVRDSILEMVQREAEKCDRLGGFLSLLSLAGGTGSGVGAYVTEMLRDEFPQAFMVNQVVWPYRTGEVIVQNYNAVLTLAHLYHTADAIVVMENDELHKICSQLLAIKRIAFKDINRVISHKLTSFLQPSHLSVSSLHSTLSTRQLGWKLQHLVPHPDHKLLTIRNIPQVSERAMEFSTFQWAGLLKHLRQMLIASAPMEEGIDWRVKAEETPRGSSLYDRSLAASLILRGKDLASADPGVFRDSSLYTPWMSPDMSFNVSTQPRAFSAYEKSATLVSNSRCATRPLDYILEKAWNMFASRAYVHQYVKRGMSEEDFLDAFVTLERVVASYGAL